MMMECLNQIEACLRSKKAKRYDALCSDCILNQSWFGKKTAILDYDPILASGWVLNLLPFPNQLVICYNEFGIHLHPLVNMAQAVIFFNLAAGKITSTAVTFTSIPFLSCSR